MVNLPRGVKVITSSFWPLFLTFFLHSSFFCRGKWEFFIKSPQSALLPNQKKYGLCHSVSSCLQRAIFEKLDPYAFYMDYKINVCPFDNHLDALPWIIVAYSACQCLSIPFLIKLLTISVLLTRIGLNLLAFNTW